MAQVDSITGFMTDLLERFVNEEETEALFAPVTSGELEGTLKWFKKDKSPRPDGWTIEFYLAFYELLGQDQLKVVEECRISRSLYNAINSTFIALIPNSDTPSSFNDYRPISLCNCLYKIIFKIIANHLHPILSCHIAPQQFDFLEHRQIHEAIGSAQEAIHTIWTRHQKAITLKIDLAKAFDRVSWLYIKMLLIHLGFPHNFIPWIMACITSPTFSVLINGSASHLFHSERGLRQGCPLSPLLFFIVMDGLSRLIATTKRDGDLCGLKISDDCFLTHLLFMDVVLIFLDGNIRDSYSFSNILSLFSSATGMLANHSKSTITFARTSIHEPHFAQQLFPYYINPLDRGLKYLGFWIKPISQKIADWVWLVTKLEKRLTIWSHRYLSRASRHVLNKIALPKKWGGWGLKDLPLFAQALAAKMGWTLLTRQNIWTTISYHKYIWPQQIMDWIRLPCWPKTGISSIWKALLHSLPLIRDNLVWRINDGSMARIGLDPWIGSNGRYQLSRDLIQHLHSHELMVLANIANPQNSTIFSQRWKSAQQLDLPQHWHQEWHEYITALSESHIRIKEGPDELIWHHSDSGLYSPKSGYLTLISHKIPNLITFWWKSIWNLTAPPRTRLFSGVF
eukprot:PITA_14295